MGQGSRAEEGCAGVTPHPVSCCLFQPSSPAQQLLQATKGHWSPQPQARPAVPKAAEVPKVPEARRKSLRQFSITTALNTLNRMVHAERPALHISSPVLISSSNPSVPTQSSDRAELSPGSPLQVRRDGTQPHLPVLGHTEPGLGQTHTRTPRNLPTPGRGASFLLPTLTKDLSIESSQMADMGGKGGFFTFI